MKENYNWWTDPKNAEEVKRISWWQHPENKTTIELPVSIVEDNGHWIITGNEETEKLIGKSLCQVASGDSKEEAIKMFFLLLRMAHNYEEDCSRKYQRWVPFRKGDWKHKGGRWFVVFGIHVYFRYGRNMKGGWYFPFTKLNVSVHNEWNTYKRWKLSNQNER